MNDNFKYEPMDNIREALDSVDTEWENILKESRDTIQTKESKMDIVTNADKSVEKIIRKALRENDASATLKGEEYGETINDGDRAYIIDPIDGTFNFAHRIPLYCNSIAYEENGEVMAAGVYFPSLDFKIECVRDKGINVEGDILEILRMGELSVSNRTTLEGSRVAISAAHGKGQEEIHNAREIIEKRGGRCYEVMCAVYLMTEVARGSIEGGIIYGLKPWDIASGYLFIEEMGGKVTTTEGDSDWSEVQKGNIVFSNGEIHDELIKIS